MKRIIAAIATVALGLGGAMTLTGTAHAAPVEVWDKVAQCESNGRWDLPYGDQGRSQYGGGLQFQPASWKDALAQLRRDGIDTSGFGQWAYNSTKNQQILAAEALLKMQGPKAWACNSIRGVSYGVLTPYKGGDYAPYLPKAPVPVPQSVYVSGKYHVVAPGDTLSNIAPRYGLEWEKLYAANSAVIGIDPNTLTPGTYLAVGLTR